MYFLEFQFFPAPEKTVNIFEKFQIGYCYDTWERSSVFTAEIIADISNVFLAFVLMLNLSTLGTAKISQINMANSRTSCPLHVRTHEMTARSAALWLGRKAQTFSGTNQKPEWPWPFETGLVRYCPQGHFSLFFTKEGNARPPPPPHPQPPTNQKRNNSRSSEKQFWKFRPNENQAVLLGGVYQPKKPWIH